MVKTKVSVIIPVKEINDRFKKEIIPALLAQTQQDFEIIILPDRPSKEKFEKTKIFPTWPKTGPGDKRNIGAQKAKGEILAFIDDDAYPDKNWIKNALKIFKEKDKIAAVCGPILTPPEDNLLQKASGTVWTTWLGSGGAGTYRCSISPRREVDDFPTVNFLVKRQDFLAVGGFDSHFWPGEDTRLCHDLVYKLGKRIIYDPSAIVFHHRRQTLGPHLTQIARYGLHRGHFARILPRTSFRIGYFIPTFFVLGLLLGFILSFFHPIFGLIWLGAIILYGVALVFTAVRIFLREKSLQLAILVMLSIFFTHLVYGALFVKGFFSRELKR